MSNKEAVKSKYQLSVRVRFWIIGIVVLCVYGKTLKFDFVGLDDKDLIVTNFQYIKDLSNIPKAFVTHAFYNPTGEAGSNAYYRPMLTLSLMFDAQLSGKSPRCYHLINILLHIVSCVLLLVFLVKLKINPDLSFLLTLLFAVHPVLSQAVSWIPGRNDSLLAVFVLAGFVFLIQYLETKNISKLFLHFLFFGLSIFTKESAIAFPLLSVLYVFTFHGSSDIKTNISSYIKSILILLAGYFVILIPWFLLRRHVVMNTTADLSFLSLSHSLIENLPLYLQSVQKSILPFNLSILSVPSDTNYILSVLLLLLIALLLVRSKNKNFNVIFFGFVWFSAILLPTFVVSIHTGFEHRVYLPMIGILLVVSEIDFIKSFSLGRSKDIFIGGCLFLVLLVIAFNHTDSFSNNYSFWETAALNSKHSSLARMNFGSALSQKGETDRAVEMYKEGLSINPSERVIHNNLGIIYARRKMYSEAEAEFKKEIEINPGFSSAYFNMGILYQQIGKDSLAVNFLEKAIEIDPRDKVAKKVLEQYFEKKKEGR